PDCNKANFASCRDSIASVGTFDDISPFGAFDMGGNVAEWTLDVFEPYKVSDTHNPSNDGDRRAPRAVRGGHFLATAQDTRSTARNPVEPQKANRNVGFRCIQ